jgi:TolA-binding protein
MKVNIFRFFSVYLGISVFSCLFSLSAKNLDASLEESLNLRRISEYWKEKDYKTAKVQIRDFLRKNPKSSYIDQLYAMLGDLYFLEKNFPEALANYEKIQDKQFYQQSLFHRLHCFYETGKYDELILSSELFLKHPNAKAEEINSIRFERGEIYFCKAFAPENEHQKKEFMKAALAEYQQLMQTKYCDMTLLPQARIFAFLEEYQKAASLFTLLSAKDSSKKEEYLFQAACLQIHFDKKKAMNTFGTIYELEGKSASKAAFNQLNLLFQEKCYRDFILAYDKAIKHITPEKIPLIQYYLGKSLFLEHEYVRAIEPLTQSLGASALDRSQEKSALLSLIAIAKTTQDLSLFEKAVATLKAKFAYDEETTNLLLMHAQLYRDKKEWSKARLEIHEILEINPKHPQREALLYDNALLLLQEEKWQESAAAFEAFLKEFPQSAQACNALRHTINCRLEEIRLSPSGTGRIKKEQLLTVLNTSIDEKKIFSPIEKKKMRYLIGKIQFELGNYEESIGNLSKYIKDFSKDPTCADAYLLMAYAHQKGERDEIHFVLNVEKALSINPTLQGAIDLHLTLFNSYLGLAEKSLSDEKIELIDKAADHLFLALDKSVNPHNQHWLAGYYFQQFKNGKGAAIERAVIVLEKSLGIKENISTLSIAPQTLEKEAEALKLGELYKNAGRFKEHVQLLETMSKEYKIHSDFPWKYQRLAHFELGKAYLEAGEKEKARNTFEDLIASSSHASSYFALAAIVEKAKLDFSRLKGSDKQENSSISQAIFDALKDVQTKRKLHSEPLHLEAGLCYVECKSQLAVPGQRNKRAIFLLEQLKESFSAPEDPLVKQYFSASSQFPDKEKLCHQYLTFIDIEIERLKAEETDHVPLFRESKEKLDQLLTQTTEETLVQRILNSRESLTKHL